MSMATGSKMNFASGSWLEVVYDVYIGAVVGASHSMKVLSLNFYTNLIRPVVESLGYTLAPPGDHTNVVDDESPDGIQNKSLKVVGVGYGRTGTYSLTLALEELGFPTLHTQHLYEHRDLFEMWANNVFVPSIGQENVTMGNPDWDMIVSHGFQATCDLPTALYFEEIMERFPDCKFILTSRDNSETWFKSWKTLTESITAPTYLGGFFFPSTRPYYYYLRWLYSVVNQDNSYLTHPFPFPDQQKQKAIDSYEEHNRRVRALVPADQLLEYSVKEGWEPLCDFLDIDECPQTMFPKTNSARSVRVQGFSAIVSPFVFAALIFVYMFRKRIAVQYSSMKEKMA